MNIWISDKNNDNVLRKKIFGITIWKIRYLKTRAKVYFLGLQLATIPLKENVKIITQHITQHDTNLETQLMQVRSFNIICNRQHKDYTKGGADEDII